jgi:hypothetical protein
MTINMSKVYAVMVNSFSDEIESAIKSGQDIRLTFESFDVVMRRTFDCDPLTSKKKWQKMIVDEVAVPVGANGMKSKVVMVNPKALCKKAGLFGDKNIKINFSDTAEAME